LNIEISKLQLYNFRNYRNRVFDFPKKINIILGKNGSGKTNILEAITLLKKGFGLKKADFPDMILQNSNDKRFSIFAKINNHNLIEEIGTSYESEKRIFQINGQKIIRTKYNLNQEIPIIFLIPQMDNIFCDNKSARRSFLDKIINNIYPEHKTNINNYNKQIKERMSLLEKGMSKENNLWLDIIEKKISEISIMIASRRNEIINYLNQAILQSQSSFIKSKINIIGKIEEYALQNTALATEDLIKLTFKENRSKDLERQRTNFGIHLSDFTAFLDQNINQKIEAKNCSTGEQKSILIAIIFGFIRIFKILNLPEPILLLDEICSHLDRSKRKDIFLEIKNLNIQSFLTGTEEYLFSDFQDKEVEFIKLL
jgi:DNA replication and repair protein RecF